MNSHIVREGARKPAILRTSWEWGVLRLGDLGEVTCRGGIESNPSTHLLSFPPAGNFQNPRPLPLFPIAASILTHESFPRFPSNVRVEKSVGNTGEKKYRKE